jgi:hypothetical protein
LCLDCAGKHKSYHQSLSFQEILLFKYCRKL